MLSMLSQIQTQLDRLKLDLLVEAGDRDRIWIRDKNGHGVGFRSDRADWFLSFLKELSPGLSILDFRRCYHLHPKPSK